MIKILTRGTAVAVLFFASVSASAAIVSYDVSGIDSWDGFGAPPNFVVAIDMAAALGAASGTSVTVDGIGWEVVVESFDPSWISEVSVAITDSAVGAGIFLSPGAGDDFPAGPTAYSSGGIVPLSTIAIPDLVLADGILRLEFYEAFDDAALTVDGAWVSGTLEFSATAVPVPAALPLLLSAMGFGALVGRRRKAA